MKLQNLYKAKAREDVAEVFETVKQSPHGENISLEEVETYCKNAAFIKLIRGNDFKPENLQSLIGKYRPLLCRLTF